MFNKKNTEKETSLSAIYNQGR